LSGNGGGGGGGGGANARGPASWLCAKQAMRNNAAETAIDCLSFITYNRPLIFINAKNISFVTPLLNGVTEGFI
jgi:hypothetical protein